ncbi:MAG: sucrase ferredoxin [Candidatus Nanopelagicales bacterium]
MSASLPCSVLNTPTTLAGTAPTATSWLILLHQGAWGDRPVDTLVLPELHMWAQEHDCKILLARTPQRAPTYPKATYWFSDGVSQLRQGTLTANGLPVLEDTHVCEQMLLICTNGKRDQCCATFGRNLISECADSLSPEQFTRILECSHLGGHRFAPTGMMLPQNLALGRLDPSAVLRLLADQAIDSRYVRGSTFLSPAQQVIQAHLWPAVAEFRSSAVMGSVSEFTVGVGDSTVTFLVEQTVAQQIASCGAEQKQIAEFTIIGRN